MSRPPILSRDAAETLALQALGHIAADPAALDRLLALTGVDRLFDVQSAGTVA